MKKHILSLLFFSSLFSAAQNPLVKMWDKRYGGNLGEQLTCIEQTNDGGFILGGYSNSDSSGDKTQSTWASGFDYWIVKIDSLGNKEWDKDFGGTGYEILNSVRQTRDGGYIIGGSSYSTASGDKTEPVWGDFDYWIVKIDSIGNKQWDKDFGSISADYLSTIDQTRDGGYILAGTSGFGISGDKTQAGWGGNEYWIIKTDSLGNKLWDKDFGGIMSDVLITLQQTLDDGFILGGYSESLAGGDKTQNSWGLFDYWIIKTDSFGNKQWDKNFGGAGEDELYSLQQTTDNGYILGGLSASSATGDKSENSWGYFDYWIVKTDSVGNKLWDKDFGGTFLEDAFGNISQTIDNGYLLAGISASDISGNKTENNLGPEQTWVIKTDSLGNIEWDKTIFTRCIFSNPIGFALQTDESCYAIANFNDADTGGYKSEFSRGNADYWIVKFCDSTLTTNISNPEKTNDQLLLWPNPTTGELKINNSTVQIDRIEIFNTLGERLYSEATNCDPDSYRECIVNCEFLPTGIYFVKVISESKVYFEKIIKESTK